MLFEFLNMFIQLLMFLIAMQLCFICCETIIMFWIAIIIFSPEVQTCLIPMNGSTRPATLTWWGRFTRRKGRRSTSASSSCRHLCLVVQVKNLRGRYRIQIQIQIQREREFKLETKITIWNRTWCYHLTQCFSNWLSPKILIDYQRHFWIKTPKYKYQIKKSCKILSLTFLSFG